MELRQWTAGRRPVNTNVKAPTKERAASKQNTFRQQLLLFQPNTTERMMSLPLPLTPEKATEMTPSKQQRKWKHEQSLGNVWGCSRTSNIHVRGAMGRVEEGAGLENHGKICITAADAPNQTSTCRLQKLG